MIVHEVGAVGVLGILSRVNDPDPVQLTALVYIAADMLTENDFEPSVLWLMVRLPESIVPAYMFTLEDEL